MSAESEKALKVISRAWGRTQSGYVFFPWIDRDEQALAGTRRAGYHEGAPFMWPQDRDKIIAHMDAHRDHDLYWCPSIFETKQRLIETAMDEHALWADLDEADPRKIGEYEPTVAWETSPGRYQALWILSTGDIQGASWPGNENQRLTYYIGADPSGWDTTQLLRIPGWKNHKLDYRDAKGNPPQGKLLWERGRTYLPDDFSELPAARNIIADPTGLIDVIEDKVSSIDRLDLLAKVRLKLPSHIREYLSAKEATGDRSEVSWQISRSLADIGCTVDEIIAILQPTPWNKFAGRHDEFHRLIIEAQKAISARPEEVLEAIEEERKPKPPVSRLALVLRDARPPTWLIQDVLTIGGVGFIAGEPKTYKSWVGLDMALSVATGADFLGHFKVREKGPVLYIQEEDSAGMLKNRAMKVWSGKTVDSVKMEGGEIYWYPPEVEKEFDPDINAYVQQGFTITDEGWQEWLDETLEAGMDGEPYKLVTIDTLMMVMGEVDENRSAEMTRKVFRPLKMLMRKHNAALQVVHHMNKGNPKFAARGGQRLLGSVANHAWSEDSLYLQLARLGKVKVTRESKSASSDDFVIDGLHRSKVWEPIIVLRDVEDEPAKERGEPRTSGAMDALKALGPGVHTTKDIADMAGISTSAVWKAMKRHNVRQVDGGWTL